VCFQKDVTVDVHLGHQLEFLTGCYAAEKKDFQMGVRNVTMDVHWEDCYLEHQWEIRIVTVSVDVHLEHQMEFPMDCYLEHQWGTRIVYQLYFHKMFLVVELEQSRLNVQEKDRLDFQWVAPVG